MVRRVLVGAVVGFVPVVVLLALRLTREGDELERFLARLLYWWMPVVLLYVGVCAAWRVRAAVRVGEWGRAALADLAVAGALTALVFWLSPPAMRVQFDETSLVGVSQNMQRLDAAVMTTGAIPYDGEVFPLENTVDKRPPLFAYLVHLVHRLAGYRVANAFVVNALLFALGLFLAARLARPRLGAAGAVAAPLLLVSVPIVGVTATSAGFELMACVWFLLAVLAALDFVARPDDARFAGLCGAVMLFAQSRYESLPAALLLLALVAWRVRRRYRPGPGGWLLVALAPALVLPLGFLLVHAQNPKFYPEAGGAPLVSFAHLAAHVGPFLRAWFAASPANPLPGVSAGLAAAALLLRLWRRQLGFADTLVAVPVLAVTLAALAWFYGDVEEPTALRLFLPFAWLCALAPLCLFVGRGRWGTVQMCVLAVALAAVRLPQLASGAAFPELRVAALTGALDGVVTRLPGDRGTTLWVTTATQYLIVRGRAALSPDGFDRRSGDVAELLRRGDLRTVYVLATSIDAAMAPAFGDPKQLLRRYPSEVVERVGGAQPITVYRLQLGR